MNILGVPELIANHPDCSGTATPNRTQMFETSIHSFVDCYIIDRRSKEQFTHKIAWTLRFFSYFELNLGPPPSMRKRQKVTRMMILYDLI